MRHMDDESRVEFELAVEQAWNSGANDRDRVEAFIDAVRDAEQAHREWAVDLLAGALRDGMWKRLKDHHKNLEPLIVNFANSEHNVPSVGGVARRGDDGKVEYRQLAFIDMTREELLSKQVEYETTAFAARRNKYLVGRLIELIDKAETATAREAVAKLRLDVDTYLAIEAS